ncbi:type II toxin-antitoxin system VapC family toxin [Umezawaea sp. Da 62-37]|uniref:type II toxin-antitoxin system VapC family toxin n=1 Tax=Umezawaea sp. Da 62-37 TaxID=3075927 RepID=UPI0028F6ED81|nr:type II toxin-antitoxin system VapC family toxin [Umezawaea sp. Da 62-37]WNV83280.1 type II toxin-antitoxin system VapC family toxin [Umezawaea sp. Da 62-37]
MDSNVILDLMTKDPVWSAWSFEQLTKAGDSGPLLINHVVYAEVSQRFTRMEDLDAALDHDYFIRAALPWPAAFLAGKCHLDYRRRGGIKTSPLPDFFIGAHAAVMKLRLLTRDVKRYRTYFPTVELIAPDA